MKNTLKRICALCVALVCLLVFLASCDLSLPEEKGSTSATSENSESSQKQDQSSDNTGVGENIDMDAVKKEIDSMSPADFVSSKEETDYVLIRIKRYGDIVVKLREDVAPETVRNFKKLVKADFYPKTIFHRVINGFMIQGGGIAVKGDGAFGEKIADSIYGEFTSNGFENGLLHLRGIISMARTPEPNSASSQFFLMHQDAPHLDGEYASFGYVVAGLDVVDAVATCEVSGSSPVDTVEIELVIFVKPQ